MVHEWSHRNKNTKLRADFGVKEDNKIDDYTTPIVWKLEELKFLKFLDSHQSVESAKNRAVIKTVRIGFIQTKWSINVSHSMYTRLVVEVYDMLHVVLSWASRWLRLFKIYMQPNIE